jgi:hypothetical protein
MALAVEITEETLAAKFDAILPHLDERQRRLLLGAEARWLGHGGIGLVAAAAGVNRDTVSAGVHELESGTPPIGRTRKAGGGRKRATEHDPALLEALDALVEPTTRGDPMTRLRWTTKSTRNLADELTASGHPASHYTVGRLLTRELDYSLQGNAKTLEGAQHPDRDAQFRYLNDQVTAHISAGQPVASIDCKKKELIGAFANNGREWQPAGQPTAVNSHDFPHLGLGKAIPYGVYDIAANTGWVSVGTDHDTAAFATATIARWWTQIAHHAYPTATRLLLCADAGGSNGYRSRLWKQQLVDLADHTGLQITVCHLPPGTSKWNKIEHRLFSQISMNWRGRPLETHQIAVNLIAGTTTRTGLRVHAELDTGTYPTGIKVSDKENRHLEQRVKRHDFQPRWNYTITPTAPIT